MIKQARERDETARVLDLKVYLEILVVSGGCSFDETTNPLLKKETLRHERHAVIALGISDTYIHLLTPT